MKKMSRAERRRIARDALKARRTPVRDTQPRVPSRQPNHTEVLHNDNFIRVELNRAENHLFIAVFDEKGWSECVLIAYVKRGTGPGVFAVSAESIIRVCVVVCPHLPSEIQKMIAEPLRVMRAKIDGIEIISDEESHPFCVCILCFLQKYLHHLDSEKIIDPTRFYYTMNLPPDAKPSLLN